MELPQTAVSFLGGLALPQAVHPAFGNSQLSRKPWMKSVEEGRLFPEVAQQFEVAKATLPLCTTLSWSGEFLPALRSSCETRQMSEWGLCRQEKASPESGVLGTSASHPDMT